MIGGSFARGMALDSNFRKYLHIRCLHIRNQVQTRFLKESLIRQGVRMKLYQEVQSKKADEQ
jgi:hypothetical protein